MTSLNLLPDAACGAADDAVSTLLAHPDLLVDLAIEAGGLEQVDKWMHATVDLVVNLVRPLVGTDRLEAALRDGLANGTPLTDVIAELGLTQEEIDGADDG